MFPNVKFIGENEIKELEKESSLGKTFLIDFTEGKMLKKDGRLIKTDDIRSIRMWIEKKLLTEKYKYKIYKTYGLGYKEMLLGKRFPTPFLYAELEREIEEEMKKHPRILEIEDFEAIMERNRLKTKFKLILYNYESFEWEAFLS